MRTGKIVFTLIYILVLILGGRCIYEDYKYGNTFKTYPGLFFINTDELFDGESINKLILVTMEEIHVELLQYKISMSSHQEQFESLQSHTSDAGAMVIILFNRDWKRMYHDYNYSLWLWVEFIFLFAVIIVAWAMHE